MHRQRQSDSSPEMVEFYIQRARRLRAEAIGSAFSGAARKLSALGLTRRRLG